MSLPARYGAVPRPPGRDAGGEGGPGLSQNEGPGPGNREGPRRDRARVASGRTGPRRPRAAAPRAHLRGRPRRRRRRWWGSFGLGPPGAPGGPRAALTVGGLQGGKDACERSSGRSDRFLPSPLLRRRLQ